MRFAAAALLVWCAAASPLFAVAPKPVPNPPATSAPKSFTDCVSAFKTRLEADVARNISLFDCTSRLFESLPESAGSTYDMGMAANRSVEMADLYIDQVLAPDLTVILQGEGDGRPMSRGFMLQAYIRSARDAGESLCELVYDYFSAGSIRSVMAGSCVVANRDRLIDQLIRLQISITPR